MTAKTPLGRYTFRRRNRRILVSKSRGLLTGYRNRKYRFSKLNNIQTQKLTFRLLLANKRKSKFYNK